MIVDQMVEGSLPTPEVRGSNPVIGKLYLYYLYSVNCFEKTKIILRKVIDGKTKEIGQCRGNLQPKNGQLIEN